MMWPTKPLSSLCLLAIDCVNKTAPVVEGPTPYKMIRTTNVKGGFIDVETVRYVSQQTYEQWTRRSRPMFGDVVLTREAPVGEVGRCTFPDTEQIFLGQRLFQYRANPELLDWNYLAYALQSPFVQNKLHAVSFGATVPHIKVGDAEHLEIPYPPLATQKVIGETLAAYDDLIENNRRRIALLEESARLLYREWFVDLRFPGHEVCATTNGIPVGWARKALGEVGIQMKELADPKQLSADTAYLSMEHMNSKSLTLGMWESAAKVSSTKLRFESDDVLFGRIRPYFHKVGIAQTSGVTSTDVIVVRAISEEFLPLVALVMSSDEFVAHAVTTSNGTKMPRADWKVLKDWPVLIPDTDLLAAFADKVLPMFRLCKAMSSQNRYLQEARNALLPKLMSGEIAV